jgi:tetratricopeptide (TPR) repeat protein
MTVKRTKRGRPQAPVNQSLKFLDSPDLKINLGATLLREILGEQVRVADRSRNLESAAQSSQGQCSPGFANKRRPPAISISSVCRRKLLWRCGDTPTRKPMINATLEIYRAASGPQYVNYPTALMVQGMIYSQIGRTAEAEQLLREAVRIRTENMPETYFLRATANGALGEFLTAQSRFSDAEPFPVASYESLKKSQTENSPRLRRALQRLANLYETWHKPEQAAPYRALLSGSTSS